MTNFSQGTPPGTSQGSHVGDSEQFTSVEHLSPEAVAAFVDEELGARASKRAEAHLVKCSECRGEVMTQLKAKNAVKRTECQFSAPEGLVSKLSQIPEGMDEQDTRCLHDSSMSVDGCRYPESILDRMDLALRKIKRSR